ncbi:Uncharacterised protein [Escherichia coli]|nr:Uncharacterised protein [Escherichia coli]
MLAEKDKSTKQNNKALFIFLSMSYMNKMKGKFFRSQFLG